MDMTKTDYTYQLESAPDYTLLSVRLKPGQGIQTEAGAMAAMDPCIQMKARFKGGIMGGVKRMVSGESLFLTEFTAPQQEGELLLAPGPPGAMAHTYLTGDTLYLQNSAFLASGLGVKVETKWQGLMKGLFSGEGLFLVRCHGEGDVWVNTFGGLTAVDVDGGYVVDTACIVGFTEGLDYTVTRVGGYKSLFFSGEGLVCRFTGTGRLWVQTRQAPAFAGFLSPYRLVKKANNVAGKVLEQIGK